MSTWRPHEREAPDSADRPSLEAALEHYGVQLKGRNKQMVRCPVHGERDPSCSIRLDEGLWNCHSCGKGGTSWDLIMAMEGVDFAGARTVAAKLGLTADGAGRGSDPVSGSAYAGRRAVPQRTGDQPRDGGYKPSWRRK